MAIQKFCETCPHRLISKSLKNKFNGFVKYTFNEECPIHDRNISGCTVKLHPVNWVKFASMLYENGELEESELINLKMLNKFKENP